MSDAMPSANAGRTGRPMYETAPPPPPRYRPRRSRTLLVALPMFAVFAAFGSIVWVAYVDSAPGPTAGEPPLIKAEVGPIKRAPDDPGGRVVPDQGEVRELLSDEPTAQAERILPAPDEPRTPVETETADAAEPDADATTETTADAATDTSTETPATAGGEGDDAEVADGTTAAPDTVPSVVPEAGPAAPEDDRVAALEPSAENGAQDAEAALESLLAEVTGGGSATPAGSAEGRQDGASPDAPAAASDGGQATDAPGTTEQPPRQAARVPEPEPSRAEAAPRQGASPSATADGADRRADEAGGRIDGTQPAPGTATSSRPDAGAPTQTAAVDPERAQGAEPRVEPVPSQSEIAAAGERYRIQLAAVRNEADARRAWDLFQLDLGQVLAGLDPIIERAETANGVFYRVQVGPFASLDSAEGVCDELKQRNASCFVIRR